MLKRMFRLLGQQRDRNAIILKSPYFTLRITKTTLPHARIGIVISKKISLHATTRNHSKRIFRSMLEREHLEQVPGYDILFIMQRGVLDHEQQAGEDAIKLLKERKILQ